MQQPQSVGSPVLLYPRINALVCALLPKPHRITLAPQPKAAPKHDTSAASPRLLYVAASCCRGVLKAVPCVYFASANSWCPNSLAPQRDRTFSKQHLVHSKFKFYTPDASREVCHLEFYIAQSVNTKIAILTKAQRTEVRASLEFYMCIYIVTCKIAPPQRWRVFTML